VRTVLFDMFGVIAEHQSAEGVAELEALSGAPAAAFWAAFWGQRQPYDRGDLDGPGYWQAIGAELGVHYPARRVRELVDADVRSWRAVNPAMVDYVSALPPAGYRLGLLSNIPADHLADFEPRQPWLEVFAVRGYSCRIRHAKPEPGAYAWCVAELGVPAGEVLFVDDRAENVAAARAAGLRGHRFTGQDGLRAVLEGGGT
jgi:putative hydrolase of the HAD superfamily